MAFENDNGWESLKKYYLATVEIKDSNVVINGRTLFDQPIKTDLKTYDNIRKIDMGQGNDYTSGCSLDSLYFRMYYKLIAIDLRQQEKLYAGPKSMQ